MNKEKFRLIFELSKKQPWIAEKYKELESLLWVECDNEDKRDLILELLYRFHYISASKFRTHMQSLSTKIVNDKRLSDSSTQLVAMAADSNSDSSQYLLYSLKPLMEKHGWRKYKQVNAYGSSYRTYKKNNKLKNIVLIDEFVGSGKTVLGRVKAVREVYEHAGVKDITILVKVIACTRQGLDAALKESIEIDAEILLEKGISDFYDPAVVTDKIKTMVSLESALLDVYENRYLPSLGYGGTECLYVRDDGNTPNSVFPIFWWPFLKTGDERKTVLTRAMGDA